MKISIQPVQVFPGTATQLYVAPTWSNSLGSAPAFYFELQDADGVALKNGNVSMTVNQWQDWEAGADDESYILGCLATNLNLTIA